MVGGSVNGAGLPPSRPVDGDAVVATTTTVVPSTGRITRLTTATAIGRGRGHRADRGLLQVTFTPAAAATAGGAAVVIGAGAVATREALCGRGLLQQCRTVAVVHVTAAERGGRGRDSRGFRAAVRLGHAYHRVEILGLR